MGRQPTSTRAAMARCRHRQRWARPELTDFAEHRCRHGSVFSRLLSECWPVNLLSVKRLLVGTFPGRVLGRGRQLLKAWRAVRANPEQGGMVSQDMCAEALLAGLCKPNTVFVDIGAHIGSVIADVRFNLPTVEIVAVEAVPEKAKHLEQRFPQVTVHSCALGERDGEVKFFVDNERPGFSSLSRRERPNVTEITVPLRKLDDVLPDAVVDFVKIDVEGAELGVLRGGSNLVDRCRPVVLFESGQQSGAAMGYPLEELYDWFAEREYDLLVPNRVAHEGPGLGREGFLESHYYPRRTLNYFGVPCERRIEVRDRARQVLGVVVPTV